MRSLRSAAVFFALAVLTAVYCWLAWLGIGVYLVTLPQPQDTPWPWITRVVVQDTLPFPFHAALMQGVAVLSLLLNFGWGVLRSRKLAAIEPYTLPVVCHVAVIVFSLCLIGVGVLAPLLGVAAVLTP
jgi:hypothetical protein